jgi:hypothetical protein
LEDSFSVSELSGFYRKIEDLAQVDDIHDDLCWRRSAASSSKRTRPAAGCRAFSQASTAQASKTSSGI